VIFDDVQNKSYYIRFYDVSYKVPTILKSIDITFKIFQVLNLSYPMESNNVWLFIQKQLFKITTPYDLRGSFPFWNFLFNIAVTLLNYFRQYSQMQKILLMRFLCYRKRDIHRKLPKSDQTEKPKASLLEEVG
jgi:hypothetical protein